IFLFDFFTKRWIEKGKWVTMGIAVDVDRASKAIPNQSNLYPTEIGEGSIPLYTVTQNRNVGYRASCTQKSPMLTELCIKIIHPSAIWPEELNQLNRFRLGSSNSIETSIDIPLTQILHPPREHGTSFASNFGFSSSVAQFADYMPSIAHQELMNILVLETGIVMHSLVL